MSQRQQPPENLTRTAAIRLLRQDIAERIRAGAMCLDPRREDTWAGQWRRNTKCTQGEDTRYTTEWDIRAVRNTPAPERQLDGAYIAVGPALVDEGERWTTKTQIGVGKQVEHGQR